MPGAGRVTIKKEYLYGGVSFLVMGLAVTVYLSRKLIYKSFDYKTNFLLLGLDRDVRRKVRKLLKRARQEGIELRVISAYRGCAEQNELYALGRTAPGSIVTNARCGQSAHNYRRAVDVVAFVNGEPLWENPRWELIGRLGEQVGLSWGGRWTSFKDRPHFEDLKGETIASLYRRFQETGELRG